MDVSLLKPFATSVIRHAASAAGGALVAWGAISQSQDTELVPILSGAGLWAAAQIWSWWQKHRQATTVANLKTTVLAQSGVQAAAASTQPGA